MEYDAEKDRADSVVVQLRENAEIALRHRASHQPNWWEDLCKDEGIDADITAFIAANWDVNAKISSALVNSIASDILEGDVGSHLVVHQDKGPPVIFPKRYNAEERSFEERVLEDNDLKFELVSYGCFYQNRDDETLDYNHYEPVFLRTEYWLREDGLEGETNILPVPTLNYEANLYYICHTPHSLEEYTANGFYHTDWDGAVGTQGHLPDVGMLVGLGEATSIKPRPYVQQPLITPPGPQADPWNKNTLDCAIDLDSLHCAFPLVEGLKALKTFQPLNPKTQSLDSLRSNTKLTWVPTRGTFDFIQDGYQKMRKPFGFAVDCGGSQFVGSTGPKGYVYLVVPPPHVALNSMNLRPKFRVLIAGAKRNGEPVPHPFHNEACDEYSKPNGLPGTNLMWDKQTYSSFNIGKACPIMRSMDLAAVGEALARANSADIGRLIDWALEGEFDGPHADVHDLFPNHVFLVADLFLSKPLVHRGQRPMTFYFSVDDDVNDDPRTAPFEQVGLDRIIEGILADYFNLLGTQDLSNRSFIGVFTGLMVRPCDYDFARFVLDDVHHGNDAARDHVNGGSYTTVVIDDKTLFTNSSAKFTKFPMFGSMALGLGFSSKGLDVNVEPHQANAGKLTHLAAPYLGNRVMVEGYAPTPGPHGPNLKDSKFAKTYLLAITYRLDPTEKNLEALRNNLTDEIANTTRYHSAISTGNIPYRFEVGYGLRPEGPHLLWWNGLQHLVTPAVEDAFARFGRIPFHEILGGYATRAIRAYQAHYQRQVCDFIHWRVQRPQYLDPAILHGMVNTLALVTFMDDPWAARNPEVLGFPVDLKRATRERGVPVWTNNMWKEVCATKPGATTPPGAGEADDLLDTQLGLVKTGVRRDVRLAFKNCISFHQLMVVSFMPGNNRLVLGPLLQAASLDWMGRAKCPTAILVGHYTAPRQPTEIFTKSITFYTAANANLNMQDLPPTHFLKPDNEDAVGWLVDGERGGFIALATDPACVNTMLNRIVEAYQAICLRGNQLAIFNIQEKTLTELATELAKWAASVGSGLVEVNKYCGEADMALGEVFKCYQQSCGERGETQLAHNIYEYLKNEGLESGWFPLPNIAFLRGRGPLTVVKVTEKGPGVPEAFPKESLEEIAIVKFGGENDPNAAGRRRVKTGPYMTEFMKFRKELGRIIKYFITENIGQRKHNNVSVFKHTTLEAVYVAEGQHVDMDRINYPR
ncbi:hypothetical protein Ndes2437A_g07146 [Nannochloris sp. 'desiccata']